MEPCLVRERMEVGRLRGSSRGRDNFGGRARQRIGRRFQSLEITRRSSTMKQRRIESGSGMGEGSPDLQFILHRFQEGLTEVGNGKHLEGTTIEDQQRDQAASSETNHRKSRLALRLGAKNMSRYERVFRSLKTDVIFVKLSKVPGGAVGAS